MPGPAWGEDSVADEAAIVGNVAALLTALLTVSRSRGTPTIALAHDWHRAIYAGVSSVPVAQYLGEVRGSNNLDLVDYEVELVNPLTGQLLGLGVPAREVGSALDDFTTSLTTAVANLDAAIPAGQRPATTPELVAVVELTAIVHGEWIRIHPYANGNGRIARTWANWVAMRYGLPPFVRIKARPDGLLYGQAAGRSMGLPPGFSGDHALTASVFLDLLRQQP